MRSFGPHGSLLAGFLLVAVSTGHAQVQRFVPESKTLSENFPGAAPARLRPSTPPVVDVLHYDLTFRTDLRSELLEGRSGLRLLVLASVRSLRINSAFLEIDSVDAENTRVPVGVDTDETITIALPRTFAAGETLDVNIWYRRLPGMRRPPGRAGYYWYSAAAVAGLPADLGYTMSEPSDTRYWLPCVDDPSDKATADIAVTVPSGCVAGSNGRLIGTHAGADGTTTWIWRETHQIAPYLLCLTISRFAIASLPYITARRDTVPLQYMVWPEDSAECEAYLPTVHRMVRALASLFDEYPFDKYAMTAIVPFSFGGMEHQTITTLNRHLKTNEAVVLHELAHQWWGDLVTCATWKDIWLNESFASYCEALWQEHLGGKTALRAYMEGAHENFQYASWSGALYDPESQGLGLFSNLVYSKGAWVLHTLRGVLGDSVFFRALRLYRERHAGGNATTGDLRSAFESAAGIPLDWFFDQWVYAPGWPVYGFAWRWESGQLVLTIQQHQQAPAPAAYTMPISIRLSSGSADSLIVVRDSLRIQTFRIPVRNIPDRVEFDPDHWILRQMGPAPPPPPPPATPRTFSLDQNFPNPFNPVTVISCQWPVDADIQLLVYDVLGRTVATLASGFYPAGRYDFPFDAADRSSGVYIYQLQAGQFFATKKMVLAK